MPDQAPNRPSSLSSHLAELACPFDTWAKRCEAFDLDEPDAEANNCGAGYSSY